MLLAVLDQGYRVVVQVSVGHVQVLALLLALRLGVVLVVHIHCTV